MRDVRELPLESSLPAFTFVIPEADSCNERAECFVRYRAEREDPHSDAVCELVPRWENRDDSWRFDWARLNDTVLCGDAADHFDVEHRLVGFVRQVRCDRASVVVGVSTGLIGRLNPS